ncbi:hypothetical protein EXIGLDRAFT_696173 [Exidia glandulosa HHB12029]|uniref:CxC2-like cysteine cluster KDZ transposase-associated domain-containing protein n=1 Tax=Exidia glandulosa HHB12029 TaxID=1314781 RepID=A0A165FI85_EXIGL|nr:hypothetical protein EXIGLDRAFT_696173 [Exidia glandulosa HHB12029]
MDNDPEALVGGTKKRHKRKHKEIIVIPDDELAVNIESSKTRRKLFEDTASVPTQEPSRAEEDDDGDGGQPEHVADSYQPGDDGWVDLDDGDGNEADVDDVVYCVRPRRTAKRIWLRSRYQLAQERERQWDALLPMLVDTYLEWRRRRDAGEELDTTGASTQFPLQVVELLGSQKEETFVRKDANEHAVIVLMRYGFLACTPAAPELAIGLDALDFYLQLRRQHPRLGVQAYARAIFQFANTPYREGFRGQMSDAFDTYLKILREVDRRVDEFLGRGGPGWRIKHSCVACTYKLPKERSLPCGRCWTMDGNGALKRHENAGGADPRQFKSDYLLTAEQVDVFKDQVVKQTTPARKGDLVQGAEPGDGSDDPIPCVSNWKNLQPEHMKTSKTRFEQTGAFVSACRHGFILWWSEMIRSGELAKYGLAHVGANLEHALEKYQRAGYDIGCGFETTLLRSLLGPVVTEEEFRLLVGSFHGHAHNRLCQLCWHPLTFEGVGLEDFETCERIFHQSNDVARGVRYASVFHYRQAINLHWRHWDATKYDGLARWLVNKYRHARRIKSECDKAVKDAQIAFGFASDDYTRWLKEEREYLRGLRDEPEADILKISYVEALQALDDAEKKYKATNHGFASLTPNHYALGEDAVRQLTSTYNRAETARRDAQKRFNMAQDAVRAYEKKLQPETRWDASCAEWRETVQYMRERKYKTALAHLERLVVQRLLELTKANMSGVGYKQRTHIANALKNRSAAIRTALEKYNEAARELDSTAAPLEWSQVVEWTELQDFTLLRFARQDIRDKPWAQPANRLLMNQYFKSIRAQEELDRLEVEIARVRQYVDDNDIELSYAVARAQEEHLPIAVELRRRQQRSARINAAHRWRLDALKEEEVERAAAEAQRMRAQSSSAAAGTSQTPPTGVVAAPELPSSDSGSDSDEERFLDGWDELGRILDDIEREPSSLDLHPMMNTLAGVLIEFLQRRAPEKLTWRSHCIEKVTMHRNFLYESLYCFSGNAVIAIEMAVFGCLRRKPTSCPLTTMASRRAAGHAANRSRRQQAAPADPYDDYDVFSVSSQASSGLASTFQPSFSVSTPASNAPRSTYAWSSPGIPSSYASDIDGITDSVRSLHVPLDGEDDMPRPDSPPLRLATPPPPVTPSSSRWTHTEPYTPRGGPLPVINRPLSHAQVREICKRFEEVAIRDLLATATETDNLENIGHGYIVHIWHLLEGNMREAIILKLVKDITNRIRLMDRLTDSSSSLFVAEPTVTPGTREIDPAHDIRVHVYTPRAVKTASFKVQQAFDLMEQLWRHNIAAPHVAGFRARVEHLMRPGSPYLNLPVINMINHVPMSRFIAPATPTTPAPETLSEGERRSIARRRKVAQGGLPQLPEFSKYVARQALTEDRKRNIQNVVLDTQVTCVSFTDWTGIFHRDYGLSPRVAAKAAYLAIEEAQAALCNENFHLSLPLPMPVIVPPRRKTADKKAKRRTAFMRHGPRAPVTPLQIQQRKITKGHRLKRVAEVARKHRDDYTDLAKELGVTEKWIKTRVNMEHQREASHRAPNAFNAFVSAIAPTYYNPNAVGRKKLSQMMADPDLHDRFLKLTEEERAQYVAELQARREDRDTVMHHSAAAQHSDVSQNVGKAVTIITGAANRCNGIFAVFYASKDGDAHGAGIHAVSQEAIPFFKNILKMTPATFGGRFDSFAASGGAEADAPTTSNVNALKTMARKQMGMDFQKLVKREKAKIIYNPLRLLEKYSIEFVGWNDGELPDPGKMNTARPLKDLIAALEAGTCHFKTVAEDEYDDRKAAILERAEAAGIVLDAPRKRRSDAGHSHKDTDAADDD